MPQLFQSAVITSDGMRLLTKAQSGNAKIEFTRVETGNGSYTKEEKDSSVLMEMTGLRSVKNSYGLSDIRIHSDHCVKVTALIANYDSVAQEPLITEGYYLNEIGLYAREKDEENSTEVLYSIAVTAGENGDFMPPYNRNNPVEIIQEYYAAVSNSKEVTIQGSMGAVALAEDLDICNSKIDTLGNKLENYLDPDGSTLSATKAMQDGDGNVISETYAKRSIYGDRTISLGAKSDSKLGSGSVVIGGRNNSATGDYGSVSGGSTNEAGNNCFVGGGVGNKAGQAFMSAIVGGQSNKMQEDYSAIAGGDGNTVNGRYSFIGGGSFNETRENFSAVLGGYRNIASGMASCAAGDGNNASNHSSFAVGHYSKIMKSGGHSSNQIGDAFVIGNGTGSSTLSNALRVTYLGDILGTKAFQSSGADYAEFIKPWADGNPDNEDRVGYFVTIKNGYLHKANEGDYITGITSGNPSVVGNADEDYYWRYERDNFNRIVMEDVPETVQATDDEGKPLFDEETHEPIMVETGNIIPNARMKLAKDYDPSLQESYVERKDRKEWDYVGMLGVLPVRDDGSCIPGQFCKSKNGGIATFAAERSIDTYMVLERISDNVVSVILK